MFHDLAHHALDCARSVVFTRLVSLAPAIELGYRVFTQPEVDPGVVFFEHAGVIHAPYIDGTEASMPPGVQAAVDDLMDFLFILHLGGDTPHVSLSAESAQGPALASVEPLFARRVQAATAPAHSLADAAYAAKSCATTLVVARLVAAAAQLPAGVSLDLDPDGAIRVVHVPADGGDATLVATFSHDVPAELPDAVRTVAQQMATYRDVFKGEGLSLPSGASSNPDDLVFDDEDLAALWDSLFTA